MLGGVVALFDCSRRCTDSVSNAKHFGRAQCALRRATDATWPCA